MEVNDNVQAEMPTLENNVQAEAPTYAIQETNAGRRLVRVEAKQEAAEPAKEEPAAPVQQEAPKVEEQTEPVKKVETTNVEEQTDTPKPYTIEEMQESFGREYTLYFHVNFNQTRKRVLENGKKREANL